MLSGRWRLVAPLASSVAPILVVPMHPSVALPPEHAAALADEASQQLREQVALETARYLADNGSRLRFHHWLDNDRGGHAFGIITGIAAELVGGGCTRSRRELLRRLGLDAAVVGVRLPPRRGRPVAGRVGPLAPW